MDPLHRLLIDEIERQLNDLPPEPGLQNSTAQQEAKGSGIIDARQQFTNPRYRENLHSLVSTIVGA